MRKLRIECAQTLGASFNTPDIATFMDRRHDNVFCKAKELEALNPDGFRMSTYTDRRGRLQPCLICPEWAALHIVLTMSGSYELKHQFLQQWRDSKTTTLPAIIPAHRHTNHTDRSVDLLNAAKELLQEAMQVSAKVVEDAGLGGIAAHGVYQSTLNGIGLDLPEPRLNHPSDLCSFTEIGRPYGKIGSAVGRVQGVKQLKTPEHGEYVLGTLENGHQISKFLWNENGRKAVEAILDKRFGRN